MDGLPADATTPAAAPASRSASRTRPVSGGSLRRLRLVRHRRRAPAVQIWKSIDGGAAGRSCRGAPAGDDIADYCGTQCFYDNVIGVDPTNSDIVYAARPVQLRHRLRRRLPLDRWRPDLEGPRLRPAPRLPRDRDRSRPPVACRHRQRRRRLVLGPTWAAGRCRGPARRQRLAEPQRHGRPDHGRVTAPDRPAITQFTSIATIPTIPARLWGGTQDNGTLRKSAASDSWFDVDERRRRPGPGRPDYDAELRLRHLLRHQSRTGTTTAAPLLHQPVHHPAASTSPTGRSSTSRRS